MKILLLGIGEIPTRSYLPQSWFDAYIDRTIGGNEIITFGYSKGVDIYCSPEDDFEKVIRGLPTGWQPDYCILTHADWVMLPKGIEDAPFPLVYVTADWDYRIPIARSCAESTDLTIVIGDDSKAGLKAIGAERVEVFHYFGVMKEHYSPSPKKIKERRYDIFFTGTLDDVSQLNRSKWVVDLCGLSDKYNVFINSGGMELQEFLDYLRDSKTVFTSNRRGEMQLRFTDAAAQGTVTIDPGVEVKKYFEPNGDYIPVENNIVEQVEKYLNNDELLQNVSDNVYQKVTNNFESRTLFLRLLDCIEKRLNDEKNFIRKFALLPEDEKYIRRGEIYYYSMFGSFTKKRSKYLQLSIDEFKRAYEIKPTPRALTNLGVATASLGFLSGEDSMMEYVQKSISILEAVISSYPLYAMAYFNLASISLLSGDYEKSSHSFNTAIALMKDRESIVDPWCLYNLEHDKKDGHLFNIGPPLNACLLSLCKGEGKTEDEIRRLFQSTILYYLAVIYEKDGQIYKTIDALNESHKLYPDSGIVAYKTANTCALLGFKEESLRMYQKAIDLLPLDVDLRIEYIEYLHLTGNYREAMNEIKETYNIVRTIRSFRDKMARLKKLLNSVQTKYSLTSVYVYDPSREMTLNKYIEALYGCLIKNPSDMRIVLRIIEIYDELGRIDKVFEIVENYIGKVKEEIDCTSIPLLWDIYNYLRVACERQHGVYKEKIDNLNSLISNTESAALTPRE